MEVSFVAKSQTLTLFSCRPLTPTSLGLIRREFLGTAHRLRPPGHLNSRRRHTCMSLFHFRSSPKFTFSASLSSQSLLGVVVAVVTFSAMTVFYWNQYMRKKIAKKVTGPSNLGLAQSSRDASNLSTLTEAVVHHVVLEDMHAKEVKDVTTEMAISSHALQDIEQQLHYQESSSFGEEIPASVGVATLDILPSLGEDSVHSNENGNVLLPHLPILHESERLEPIVLTNELAEPQVEGHKEVERNLHLEIIDKSHSAASLHHVWDFPEVVAGGESTSSSYDDSAIESARADLYTFYDSKKSETRKVKTMNSFRKVSSQARHVNGNALSSVTSHSMLKEHGLTLDDTILNKEDVGANIPSTFYKEGSSSKRKGTVQGLELPRGKEGKESLEKKYRQASQMPHPNGVQEISEECAATQYSDYNILLRRGRVGDCLKLLEDMEARGLLNMDKIYHGRFYDTCKNHKAVEEAFRFTNFISSPTLSTFNMLMSVCTVSQDLEGAFRVLQLAQEAGLRADCKLYTTLISTCAKCGKVDRMFEVFHEMVSAGVEPNLHTYGALIDGCARAGQVAKAFGAYGILRSKKVKPDRVIFNALITACGQCGAVDRAFDVLAEMGAETHPIDPDHVTVGALMKACSNAGQVERAREVYKMLDKYKIRGTPEVYSIALNCCCQNGDWEFAMSIYNDMLRKNVGPDEMFLSALIDVAGHAGNVDPAFQLLEEATNKGMQIGIISYSSLMGACSNAKNWEKAIKLYEDLKSMNMKPTISTMNALITALCEGDQLSKAINVLSDMRAFGLCPNEITYSILLVASEKKDDIEVGSALYYQAKEDAVPLNITMCKCMIGMCLRRYEKACSMGEPVLSLDSAWPQVDSKWSSLALTVYRESISAGITPTIGVVSRVLGCLQFPYDASLKSKIIENLGVTADPTRFSNLFSLVEGFGEYDPRAFSLLEEAASLGVVPFVSFKRNPILVDAKELHFHTAEVYILTLLRGLKHRLAAGAKLPNITIVLPVETTEMTSPAGEKTVSVAGRISQGVAALLRRMGIRYQGNESFGKIKINGLTLRRWLQPKLASPGSGKPGEFGLSQTWMAKGITDQQRDIRTGNLSLD